MKPATALLISASLSLTVLASSVNAITVNAVPNPRLSGGWVSDTQDLISPDSEAALNRMLTVLEAETGTEMTVVTVDNTQGANSPKAFATELFNTWGVGKADVNNGVLFLVSVGDRRSEVEVGYGLTAVLPAPTIESLLEREANPAFKQGDFDTGIVSASEALVNILNNEASSPVATPSEPIQPALQIPEEQIPEEPYYPQVSITDRSSETITERLVNQPNGVKFLVVGSGLLAFLLGRFGKPLLTHPTALAPGRTYRNVGFDFTSVSPKLSIAAVGFLGAFGVGAIAILILDMGPALLGGIIGGLCGAGAIAIKNANSDNLPPFECEKCQIPMETIAEDILYPQLNKAQKIASRNLHSATYKGWKCPACEGLAIRMHNRASSYRYCPNCQEPTVEQTRTTLTPATYHHGGQEEVTKTCHSCDYSDTDIVHIPQRVKNNSGYVAGGYSGGSSGGSSGGGFGGGSSGGGGGGSSW